MNAGTYSISSSNRHEGFEMFLLFCENVKKHIREQWESFDGYKQVKNKL